MVPGPICWWLDVIKFEARILRMKAQCWLPQWQEINLLSSCILAMSCTSWTSLSLWLTDDSDMAEVVDRRSMVSRSSTRRSCDDSRDSRLDTSQLETEHIIIVVALLWTLWHHSGDYKIYPRTQYIFRISATDRKQLRAGQVQKWRSRNNKNSYINTEGPGCGMIWSNMIRTVC